MTTTEVANRLVALCQEGKFIEACNELYADNVVSIEPQGSKHEKVYGKEAVLNKTIEFVKSIEKIHSNIISDPLVAGRFFSVMMDMKVTMTGIGKVDMNEICLYEVENGKVIEEEFFFSPN